MADRWSPDHLRLHRWLRHRPGLLPARAVLLLAVSGGQDSMTLVALLQDLRRLYGWSLHLWHGDHALRPESAKQAQELADWARQQQLPLKLDTWSQPRSGEAAARSWRYACLIEQARALGAGHVITGHTASDRAETLLLNLARGCHRRGLASLRARRPLAEAIVLVRPLLAFSRTDTARISQQLALPVWPDPSNESAAFSRNRIRNEVLPVLENLHPGAAKRLSALSERLGEEEPAETELVELALAGLQASSTPAALDRAALMALAPANRRRLLRHWLQQRSGQELKASTLETVLTRLDPQRGPGRQRLSEELELQWDRQRLWLAASEQLP